MRWSTLEIRVGEDSILLGRSHAFFGLPQVLLGNCHADASLHRAIAQGDTVRNLRLFCLEHGLVGAGSGISDADIVKAVLHAVDTGMVDLIYLRSTGIVQAVNATQGPQKRDAGNRRNGRATPARPPATTPGGPVATAPAGDTRQVSQWSAEERIAAVIRRAAAKAPGEMRDALLELLSPESLAIIAGFVVVSVAANMTPYGWIADAVIAGVAFAFGGLAALRALKDLAECFVKTSSAQSEADLDEAADSLARAVAVIGVLGLMAILHRVASRGPAKGGPGAAEEGAGESTAARRTGRATRETRQSSERTTRERPTEESRGRQSAVKEDPTVPTPVGQTVYRVDGRSPGVIFEEGFQPKGTSTDLKTYVDTNQPSAFVSTSKSPEIAKNPDFAKPGKYVYEIDGAQVKGVDVNKAYPTNPFANESEIAVVGGVPRSAIISARPILGDGSLGEVVPNPFYTGGQ